MKKLVFGLVGFLMLITVIGTVIVIVFSPRSSCSQSCESNAVNSETVSKDESQCVYTKTHHLSGERGEVCCVRHFEYGGHKYIQFQIWATHGGNSGVVHDPDCPCHAGKDTLK